MRVKHRNLPLLMLQAREAVIARFRPLLNANGVTEQQWRIVRLLLDTGPLEPRQIGDLCNLSSPSLAGVLARMEQIGLVRRKRLPNDQRRVSVSLTAQSRDLAQRMAPRIEALYRQIDATLGAEFSAALYRSLDQVIARLKAGRPATPRAAATRAAATPGAAATRAAASRAAATRAAGPRTTIR